MLDIDTCAAEARTLHPSSDGWFAILQKIKDPAKPLKSKAKQSLHHMGSLDAVVRALDRMPDAYLSQSSFICAKRRVTTFKSVNCAFVDIDCYSDKPNSPKITPDDQFIEQLLANARAAGLPEPSYITYSGRGVYCKWVFDRPISAHQLLRWQALQNVLTPLYTAFGVDASARDAARVLRVMGSTHAEAGNVVRVGLNTNRVHNFDALCRAAEQVDTAKLVWPASYGISGRTVKARINKIKKNSDLLGELDQGVNGDLGVLSHFQASREPVMLKFGTRDHLNWSRFVDMRTLAELRGGIHPGSRDVTLFWMATTLAHAGVVTSENIESEIGELVGAFSGPDFDPIGDRCMMSLVERLKEKEAGRVVHFKGGSYDPLYTPTNDHLIDVLDITAEEQEKLTTIIGGQEKLRRADGKVEGRADRRQQRIEWRGLARQMEAEALAAGETRYKAQIARALGVDRGEISRLLTGKLDRDPTRIETRGRKKIKRPESMVRIVVARRGGLSRAIWVNAEQAANAALDKAMGRPSQRPAFDAQAEPPPIDPPALQIETDLDQLESVDAQFSNSSPAPTFKSDFVSSLALAFPKRVLFSISRKRRAGEEAFARETESKGYEGGGPLENPKEEAQTAAAPLASTKQAWAGWGALAETGMARKGITGKRQTNQASVPSEGRVTIRRADGSRKSIPLVPVSSILKTVTPSYVDAATGVVDFIALRAEAARLIDEQKRSIELGRIRDVALDEAKRARDVLASVNHLKDIRDRAMSKTAKSGESPSTSASSPDVAAARVAQHIEPTGARNGNKS